MFRLFIFIAIVSGLILSYTHPVESLNLINSLKDIMPENFDWFFDSISWIKEQISNIALSE